MNLSRTVRVGFLSTLFTAIGAMVVLTGWLVWPSVQEWWTIRTLVEGFRVATIKNDSTAARAATTELRKIGDPVVPALIGLFNDSNSVVRLRSRQVLHEMGENPKAAIPVLVEELDTEHGRASFEVYLSLSQHRSEAKDAVPALRRALKDSDSGVRCWAAWLSGRIGPPARMALPELRELLRDEENLVRLFANDAIVAIGESPTEPATASPTSPTDTKESVADPE